MDTVWIKLTKMSSLEGGTIQLSNKVYMFGPTGVNSFEPRHGATVLTLSNGKEEHVEEGCDVIMSTLQKIRKTAVKPKKTKITKK
jgi:hypothetical protein